MTQNEHEQLLQTIEMFEVVLQTQPHDYQSLEILKEAYLKLGRDGEAIQTSRRIAEAYTQLGQISAAMLEYESILQRQPDDPDAQQALQAIQARAGQLGAEAGGRPESIAPEPDRIPFPAAPGGPRKTRVEDGAAAMRRLFVDGKHISEDEFDLCWPAELAEHTGETVAESFVARLHEHRIMEAEKTIKLLSEKSRCAYLPLGLYEVNMELARSYPASLCRRWCVLPIDQMSNSLLVATNNPFNQQAAAELQDVAHKRILWYLAMPQELVREINKAFR